MLFVLINPPAEIARCSLADGGSHRREVRRNVMFKPTLADTSQQHLKIWNMDHAGTAECLQWILCAFSLANITVNNPFAIIGREVRIPGDGDQRSEVMAITIPKPWRSAFRTETDRYYG